ncbi:hypothetical protein DFH27DRAFT_523770 [Peziza echinospora]|nr:hypothetical protein DFH27DRAFT_523770 [Peziza echinospora]
MSFVTSPCQTSSVMKLLNTINSMTGRGRGRGQTGPAVPEVEAVLNEPENVGGEDGDVGQGIKEEEDQEIEEQKSNAQDPPKDLITRFNDIFDSLTTELYFYKPYNLYVLLERANCLSNQGFPHLAIGDANRILTICEIMARVSPSPASWLGRDIIAYAVERALPPDGVPYYIAMTKSFPPNSAGFIDIIVANISAVLAKSLAMMGGRFEQFQAVVWPRIARIFFSRADIYLVSNQIKNIHNAIWTNERNRNVTRTRAVILDKVIEQNSSIVGIMPWRQFPGNVSEFTRVQSTTHRVNKYFDDNSITNIGTIRIWDPKRDESPRVYGYYTATQLSKDDVVYHGATGLAVDTLDGVVDNDRKIKHRCAYCFRPVELKASSGAINCCAHGRRAADRVLPKKRTVYCNAECKHQDRHRHRFLHRRNLDDVYIHVSDENDTFPLFLIEAACSATAISTDYNPLNLPEVKCTLEEFPLPGSPEPGYQPLLLNLDRHYAMPCNTLLALGINVFQNQSYDTHVLFSLRHKWENSKYIRNGGSEELLFPILSWINHSCEPNCAIIDDENHPLMESPKEIVIYAIRDIAIGEELTISYIGDTSEMDYMTRRRELVKKGVDRCICKKCVRERAIRLGKPVPKSRFTPVRELSVVKEEEEGEDVYAEALRQQLGREQARVSVEAQPAEIEVDEYVAAEGLVPQEEVAFVAQDQDAEMTEDEYAPLDEIAPAPAAAPVPPPAPPPVRLDPLDMIWLRDTPEQAPAAAPVPPPVRLDPLDMIWLRDDTPEQAQGAAGAEAIQEEEDDDNDDDMGEPDVDEDYWFEGVEDVEITDRGALGMGGEEGEVVVEGTGREEDFIDWYSFETASTFGTAGPVRLCPHPVGFGLIMTQLQESLEEYNAAQAVQPEPAPVPQQLQQQQQRQ